QSTFHFLTMPRPPLSPLFPYTTLFRSQSAAAGSGLLSRSSSGRIFGSMTGAKALVETLIQEGTECVFGIPGAQENELWDTFKTRDRKSTRLNSSHLGISYAVFCLKKKN